MSNIDKTRENVPAKRTRTLPDPKEVPTLCLHVSEDAFFEGVLEVEGMEKPYQIIAVGLMTYSIKDALEKDNPVEKDLVISNVEEMISEYDFLANHKEENIFGGGKYVWRARLEKSIVKRLEKRLSQFITPELRECAVKQHARGKSTVNVIEYLLSPVHDTPNVFYFLAQKEAYIRQGIIKWLTPRLAYLRLGTSGFPQKYRGVWDSEREKYLEEISNVPLTNTTEQVKALSDLYLKLEDSLTSAETDRGRSQLASSMVKVMSGLYTLTRDPSLKLPE